MDLIYRFAMIATGIVLFPVTLAGWIIGRMHSAFMHGWMRG